MSEMSENVVQNGEAENGNVLLSQELSETLHVKDRVIHKAKRNTRTSPAKEDGSLNGNALLANRATAKNARKSRSGYGRGLPKKGGAGGKHTWGAPGSELMEDAETDMKDPNYDSETEVKDVKLATVKPPLSDDEFLKIVEPLLLEYLEHGDPHEVVESLLEVNIMAKKHRVPHIAVSLALDRKAMCREMTSRLLSHLYGEILSQQDMSKGFDHLLHDLADLSLDAPDAPTVVGQFVARAIADDCLPPVFIKAFKGKVDCPYIRKALDKSEVLMNMNHGIVRLDNVWGVGGGIRPVKILIKKMVLLLQEYLNSGDAQEAVRCLQELEVPHFHHELVYEAFVMVIEKSDDWSANLMAKLLQHLSLTNIVTPNQMTQGLQRVFDNMPEINLDVPAAYALLERFGKICYEMGFISEKLYKEMPIRGRKRFVSEGDGGRVKPNTGPLI